LRTRTGVDKGKDQGHRIVTYRDAKGNMLDAHVVGQGTSSGLKLSIRNSSSKRVVDNVALGTAANQTNVYFTAGR
jgi:hypothetical protein